MGQSLTKDFIDKNTRTVTTTYWNLLTTETETVSQTVFSEEDIAFFQNNILYYGFDSNKAIGSGHGHSELSEKRKMIHDEEHAQSEEVESVEMSPDTECDSF